MVETVGGAADDHLPPVLERRRLPTVKAVRRGVWSVEGASGTVEMRPSAEIGDEVYETYLKVIG